MGQAYRPISFYYLSSDRAAVPSSSPEGALLRLALTVNQRYSLREAVDLIFDALDALVPYDRIGVALLDPDGWLVSRAVRSRYPIIWGEGARSRLHGSSLEPIVRNQQIRIIDDLEAYAREHPYSRTTPLLVQEGMRSSLALPLITEKKAVGVMFFTSTQPGAYRPEHVDFLRALATGVAIALERANLHDALSRALTELKTLDQLKTNFLSNLSHELRTPLSIVLSYLQTLDDETAGSLTTSQHDLLAEGIRAADHLKDLLSDLFDFTELVAGVLHLDCREVDMVPLLHEVADETLPAFQKAGLDFQLQLPPGTLPASADPPRLAKAVKILLDNARKFTPAPGSVTLRAEGFPEGVLIEVEDTGIGIPAEYHHRIFEKFFQIESGPGRQYGGAGLGLALTRAIVQAHHGRLSLRSAPGQGSAFRVMLPHPLDGPPRIA